MNPWLGVVHRGAKRVRDSLPAERAWHEGVEGTGLKGLEGRNRKGLDTRAWKGLGTKVMKGRGSRA